MKAKTALKTGKGPTHLRKGFEKSKRAQRPAAASVLAEAAAKKAVPVLHGATVAAIKVPGDAAEQPTKGVSPEEKAAALAKMAALQRGELHFTTSHGKKSKKPKKNKGRH